VEVEVEGGAVAAQAVPEVPRDGGRLQQAADMARLPQPPFRPDTSSLLASSAQPYRSAQLKTNLALAKRCQ
jgi:hypothetical protein